MEGGEREVGEERVGTQTLISELLWSGERGDQPYFRLVEKLLCLKRKYPIGSSENRGFAVEQC